MTDFREYYNLESYLLRTVHCRFAEHGYLSAFDFFCIVVWKANRAKSKVARKLLAKGHENLDEAVYVLTSGVASQASAKHRLHYLMRMWEIPLAMASAILTVLYPEEFTVYDTRVCDVLGGFHSLGYRTNFDNIWKGYQEFKREVEGSVTDAWTLREKDRYLWGKSFYQQLVADIERGFGAQEQEGSP